MSIASHCISVQPGMCHRFRPQADPSVLAIAHLHSVAKNTSKWLKYVKIHVVPWFSHSFSMFILILFEQILQFQPSSAAQHESVAFHLFYPLQDTAISLPSLLAGRCSVGAVEKRGRPVSPLRSSKRRCSQRSTSDLLICSLPICITLYITTMLNTKYV